MGTIAIIESLTARFLTAAFGSDYLEDGPHHSTDNDSVVVADDQTDLQTASEPGRALSAGDAAEKLPLCAGVASVLALSMLHVLWNELGDYDEKYLSRSTNAPYLVGEDGYYLRDEVNQRPLVLDGFDRRIKTADDRTLSDPSIKWTCEVRGRQGRPAFELLRESLAWYAPELIQPFTKVPALTVRRMAEQFSTAVEAAESRDLTTVSAQF